MNEITEFLKNELARVQNERDAAQANERQVLAVIAELRQQVGLLMSVAELTARHSAKQEYLHADAINEVLDKVTESEARIRLMGQTRAFA